MKNFCGVFLALISFAATAQNYRCLQPGSVKYFQNDVVRAIKIDSVIVTNGQTIFYPFRSPRGAYVMAGGLQQLDSNGGSWVGKKVIELSDGTTLFDTYWGDTVVIKTRAGLNDSWIFYNDTSSRYYVATVTSIDTFSSLGAIDSLKNITITAYNSSGSNSTDIANNLTIKLSKNHGLYETFSLYTFPFHPADTSTYQTGLDYLMDELDVPLGAGVKSYRQFRFNYSSFDILNYNVGDVVEYRTTHELSDPHATWEVDSVTSRNTLGTDTLVYQYTDNSMTYVGAPQTPYVYNTGTFGRQIIKQPVFDTTASIVFEEKSNETIVSVDLEDSSFCLKSPKYNIANSLYYHLKFEPCYTETTYKVGIGITHYFDCIDPSGYFTQIDLMYSRIGTHSCGNYVGVTGVEDIAVLPVKLYPNPAKEVLYVDGFKNALYQVCDITGRVLTNGENKNGVINLSMLQDGIYILKLSKGNDLPPISQLFLVKK